MTFLKPHAVVSLFILHYGYINGVCSVRKHGEPGVETSKNCELEKEVHQLEELVKRQSKLISDSADKITRLEASLERMLEGGGTYSQLSFNRKRTMLKIERGPNDQESHSNVQTLREVGDPIAFVAYMKHFHTSKEYPPGSILPFELTTLNYGNHYNKSSGLFTCPISGLYKLDWALAYYYPNTTLASKDILSDEKNYTLDVDFTIVYLNKSDTAGVTNPDDDGIFMPYFSKFSGFKISG